MVVVLGAAAMMLWPLLWPPDPDASVQLVNGRLVGETSGYVGRVDRTTQTVDISSSLVGWRPIMVVVNDQTAIMVQNRQGGFGDLLKDLPVRVSYEVVGDRRLAKSIEVVTEDSERARGAAGGTANGAVTPALTSPAAVPALPPVRAVTPPAVRLPADVPAQAARPPADVAPPAVRPPADVPAPRAVDVAPPRAAVPAPPAKAPTVAPAMPPPAAKPPVPVVREPVALPVPPPAAKPPAPVVREAPPRVEPAAPRVSAPVVVEPPARFEPLAPRAPAPRVDTEAPSSARPARPAEPDAPDGAAAVDWLLKRGR